MPLSKVRVRNPAVRDIEHVLRAWSSRGDYNIDTISVDTAMEMIDALARGASPFELAEHGRHVLADCQRERWDVCDDEKVGNSFVPA